MTILTANEVRNTLNTLALRAVGVDQPVILFWGPSGNILLDKGEKGVDVMGPVYKNLWDTLARHESSVTKKSWIEVDNVGNVHILEGEDLLMQTSVANICGAIGGR